MKRSYKLVGAFIIPALLAACGGGVAPAPSVVLPQESRAASGASCGTVHCLYVANRYGNSITIYPRSANGNVTPAQVITGSYTGLNNPISVAFDKNSNIYVANLDAASITVYAAGAYGNVAPIRTISGSYTGLSGPAGVAVDSEGEVYVTDNSRNTISVFAAGANGNVAPIRVVSGSYTGLNNPIGITLYSKKEIVANWGGSSITVYPTAATGNVAPARTISGSYTDLAAPQEVAISDAGTSGAKVYVANTAWFGGSPGILVFAAGANGNVAPIASIMGSNTGLQNATGVAVDRAGRVYVGDGEYNNVNVFAEGANGNVAPIRTITGSYTGLDFIQNIALH